MRKHWRRISLVGQRRKKKGRSQEAAKGQKRPSRTPCKAIPHQ